MGELKSREKYNELVALLQQAGDEWVVPGPVMTDDDVAEGFRNLTHILQSALYSHQEFDPQRPVFNRIVSPTRSFTAILLVRSTPRSRWKQVRPRVRTPHTLQVF